MGNFRQKVEWLDYDEKYRKAIPSDLEWFHEIWGDFLNQQWETGGDFAPTSRTLSAFTKLFSAYADGTMPGVVIFGDRGRGVLMWGDPLMGIDLRYENCAQGWGTYVMPEHRGQGISRQMREHASKLLREQGFAHVLGSVSLTNKLGYESGTSFGFEIISQQGVLRL